MDDGWVDDGWVKIPQGKVWEHPISLGYGEVTGELRQWGKTVCSVRNEKMVGGASRIECLSTAGSSASGTKDRGHLGGDIGEEVVFIEIKRSRRVEKGGEG